jgi:arylsulfatase A-like enzyme
VTILWLCEPDTSGHYAGLGSAGNLVALRRADAAFGRILDDWQAGPMRERLHVMAASDHGHATVEGSVDVSSRIAALPAFEGCRLLAGLSGGVVVPGGEADRISRIAEWLSAQEWIGHVFAADGAELPGGVLPRSAALVDHARAAEVLFTLRAGPGVSAAGLPGVTLNDGALPVGAGMHGGLSAAEMHTVMVLAGPRVRAGHLAELPSGLADIAPTALALLGVAGGAGMDGRVLAEALADLPEPEAIPAAETWEAADGPYRQRLARTRLGPCIYLDLGERL